MSTPRLLDTYLSYKYFDATSSAREVWSAYSILNKINWFCFVAEYFSLFTLSYVTMKENYCKLHHEYTRNTCSDVITNGVVCAYMTTIKCRIA